MIGIGAGVNDEMNRIFGQFADGRALTSNGFRSTSSKSTNPLSAIFLLTPAAAPSPKPSSPSAADEPIGHRRGVETELQREMLAALGCDSYQGYSLQAAAARRIQPPGRILRRKKQCSSLRSRLKTRQISAAVAFTPNLCASFMQTIQKFLPQRFSNLPLLLLVRVFAGFSEGMIREIPATQKLCT